MTGVEAKKPQESLQDRLTQVVELLHRHKMVEDLTHRQEDQHHDRVESLVHWQNLVELQRKLEELHPADTAHIFESLPLDDRLTVQQLVKPEDDGDILLEISDAVRETLIADMDDHGIIAAAKGLDANELADLAPELLRDVIHELVEGLDAQQRKRARPALSCEEDQVGALMDFEMVIIREDISLEAVLRCLYRLKELPGHTDKLFVVDYDDMLRSVLPIKCLPVNNSDKQVLEVMVTNPVAFHPDEDGYDAARVFERYDLISASVVDKGGKPIGRLTISETIDLIHGESENEVLNMAGLREKEDIFASVQKSVRNRWAWLVTNLIAAFVISRVTGLFEGPIEELMALTALMPIAVDTGGNSGSQTITMIVHTIAPDQIQPTSSSRDRLLREEPGVALVNSLAWGGTIGIVTFYFYDNWELGVVMTAAMTLSLLLAAMMGVLIPITLHRFGRDPAMGFSVMIATMTDSGGSFIFLSSATIFLMWPECYARSHPWAVFFMAVRSAEKSPVMIRTARSDSGRHH